MHVGGALEAGVVELDVGVEHLVGGLVVALVGLPALEHRLGTEVWRMLVSLTWGRKGARTGEVRIVDLDVADSL